MAAIKSTGKLPKEIWANVFLSIFQASVPDVNKPPLYVDFQAHPVGDTLEIDSAVTERLRNNFVLETMIGKYADNLKTLRICRRRHRFCPEQLCFSLQTPCSNAHQP